MADFIFDIIKIVQKEITEYQYYIYIAIRLIRQILLGYMDCYAKLAMHEAFISPYSLLVFRAIYENLFLIIYTVPFIFINIEDLDGTNEIIFKGFLNYLNGIKILYSILYFIDVYLRNLFIIYIIDKFSPSHYTLAMTLEAICKNADRIIKSNIDDKEVDWDKYANCGIFLILFIASMIHNEIFIINKCGLNEKTKLFLNKKFDEEKNNSRNNTEVSLIEIEEKDKKIEKEEERNGTIII